MMKNIQQLEHDAITHIQAVDNLKTLEELRVHYLGKKGILTEQLKSLGQLDVETRKTFGQAVNQLKNTLQKEIADRQVFLQEQALDAKLSSETIDVSLDGIGVGLGSFHPVTLTMEKIKSFFMLLGFSVEEGPEVEDDFHNFEALNIPSYHPARASHDTFYFEDNQLLRTHTSGVQIRVMEQKGVPVRMIAPGRVYRCDSDITHTPMFHQVEGLWIDEDITFADLKGLLNAFLEDFFEAKVKTRFRPSYFPFTEPSAEVDVECVKCKGDGCRICKNTGWLEVLGAGMVHPNVLKAVNIDDNHFQGLAFGLGVERLAMLKFAISDIRILYENDVRFLNQFKGW